MFKILFINLSYEKIISNPVWLTLIILYLSFIKFTNFEITTRRHVMKTMLLGMFGRGF